jgi:hypothetical protein
MENAENQAKWDTRHRKKTIKAHKKTQRRKLTEKQSATRTPPNNEHMVDRMGQNYVATRTPPNNEHMVDRMVIVLSVLLPYTDSDYLPLVFSNSSYTPYM